MADLDVLKEIPGYKAILKSVLKSQIQLLLEQLSSHTGEESIILTASVHDGSLSHLGSCTGKGFLEGREEIKSQFLGYCLKSHHQPQKPETHEVRGSPYQRNPPAQRGPAHKKPRLQSSYSMPPQTETSNRFLSHSAPNSDYDIGGVGGGAYLQRKDNRNAGLHFGQGQMLSSPRHSEQDANTTQVKREYEQSVSPAAETGATSSTGLLAGSFDNPTQESENHSQSEQQPDDAGDNSTVKIEAVSDNEFELEITGVEMGDTQDTGAQGSWGLEAGMSAGESGLDTSMEQAEYKTINILDRHESIALSQIKVFMCPTCRKPFADNYGLTRHLRVHTGERPFACEHCDQAFKRKDHLQSHIFLKHGSKITANV